MNKEYAKIKESKKCLLCLMVMLLLLVCIALRPIKAQAERGKDGVFTYYTDRGITTATIMRCDSTKGELIIPKTLDTLPVVAIDNTTFYNYTDLTDVIMQEGLEHIGRAAFFGCTNLTSVTIPASVAQIDRNAFEGCTNLKRVNITDIAAWCAITFENEQANPLWYGADLYLNGEKVTDLIIPDGVKQIEFYAFAGCGSITGVKMANTVDLLGPGAFWNCENLKNVTLSPKITAITDWTFADCKSLTDVTFHSGVRQINHSAFWNCAVLSDIYYGGTQERWDNMPSIWREEHFKNATVHFVDLCGGSHIWDKGNLKKIPTHLESGEKTYTCYSCSETRNVTIPPIAGPAADATVTHSVLFGPTPHDVVWIVTSDGTLALGGTGEMINYRLDDIKNDYCSDRWRKGNPTRIIINEGITRIGENAFYGMNTVTEVVLPKSLESIGDGAFGGIDTFEKIKFYYGGTKEMWYTNKGLSGVLYPFELVFDSNGNPSTEPTTQPTTEPTTAPTAAEPTMGSTAEPTTNPVTAPTSESATVPTVTAAAESTAATEQADSGKKGGSGWLITVVVVAVLAAGGAAAFVILKKKQK